MIQPFKHWRWLLLLALLLVAVPVLAQTAGSYDLRWWTADAGRSQLEAGSYTLGGAAGQPDVHTSETGGYTLRGGFWAPASATTPDGLRVYLPLVRKE